MISAHSNIHPTSKIRRPKSHVAKMAVGDQQNPHFRAFLQNVFVSGPNRFKLQISIVLIFRWRLKLLVTGIYIYTIINIYIYIILKLYPALYHVPTPKRRTQRATNTWDQTCIKYVHFEYMMVWQWGREILLFLFSPSAVFWVCMQVDAPSICQHW